MSSTFRNFVISFIIATLIFTGVAVFGVDLIDKYVLNPDSEKTAEKTGLPSDILDTEINSSGVQGIGSGNTFSFLLIGSDYLPDVYDDYNKPFDGTLGVVRTKSADTIIFGMFHKELNEFVLCPINPETVVYVEGVKMTLAQSYGYKDEAFLCSKVSSLVGISVDYYASVEIPDLIQIIDYIGGVDYELDTDIHYVNDKENINIKLQKGKHHLNGAESIALLRYNGYRANTERMSVGADFCLEVIRQMTSDYLNKYKYPTMYEYFAERVKTNYTLAALEKNVDLIFKFSSMSVSYINYPGTFTQEGFVPGYEKGKEMFEKYR